MVSTIEVPMTFDAVTRNPSALSSSFEGCRAGVILLADGLACLTAEGWILSSDAARSVKVGEMVDLKVVFDDRVSPARVEYWIAAQGAWQKIAEGDVRGNARKIESIELEGPAVVTSLRGDYQEAEMRHGAVILLS